MTSQDRLSPHVMISVVIPTLNAAARLPACLTALMPGVTAGLICEVIIADGGSDDPVEAIAANAGATFLKAPRGRGQQLAAGADKARGDWLLFLHADTVLEPGWVEDARQFIHHCRPDEAAYFSFRFDDRAWQARLIEVGVALRCALFQLPYGDQALLISRPHYQRLGGYADLPLFEDVHLIRRIARSGSLTRLKTRAVTAATRHRRDGWWRRVWKNFRCLTAYFRGVPVERIVKMYR